MTLVHGRDVDEQSRCAHWSSPSDVIAIEFPCCNRFFACFECHHELEDHESERWPEDRFDQQAILCGVCKTVLSIRAYLTSDFACPACGAAFNPQCATHYDLYFELGA